MIEARNTRSMRVKCTICSLPPMNGISSALQEMRLTEDLVPTAFFLQHFRKHLNAGDSM